MVAAANTALSATADGNQKKPGFPGFIPPGANPQQVAAALAARTAPNVLAGTGLGMGDPMKQVAPIAPAVGGGLAPAFGSGLYGENARYNALPQDNAKNAGATAVGNVPALPAQPKLASAGVDGIPTGGLAGWAGGAAPQAPKTAFGDMQATIQNQVEKAVWGSNLTPTPSTGLPSAQKPAAAPVSAPYRNDGQNYPAGGKAQSPAVTTAPAKPSKASGPANPTIGVASPFTAPTVGADGQVIALGSGKQIGGGVTRYDIPGKSTLYSNKTGSQEGVDDTLNMLNRRPVTPQNQKAMDASVARSEKQIADGVKLLQYKAQVAEAQAFRKSQAEAENSPRALMQQGLSQLMTPRQLEMAQQKRNGETDAQYQVRMQSLTAQQQGIRELATSTANAALQAGNQRVQTDYNNARLVLDAGNAAVNNEKTKAELARDERIRVLQDKYLAATGAEQEALGKQLLTMSNKDPKSSMKDNFMVVGGGQEWDAQANSMRNVPQRLIDLRTVLPVGGGAQSTQSASSGQKYEVGQTVQRADGQKARVTAVDANGQPTKFQPL
jgi:hypothetical protein